MRSASPPRPDRLMLRGQAVPGFRRPLVALVGIVALIGTACGSAAPTSNAGASGAAGSGALSGTIRLGYFPNITHATAIVGVEGGLFQKALGPGVTFEPKSFNAGPAASEALLSGAIDATCIGPNPAINAFAKSGGSAIRIIAGATSGGAALVVKPDISSAAQLKGRKLATPQLGNTQDVALRTWLADNGLQTDPTGGGDVTILPQDNAQTLQTFSSGQIDGAWVPEPWATRLVQEGGGKVLVDERSLWPDGRFVTTHLVVRTDVLTAHPDLVSALLAGDLAANDFVNSDPARAQQLTNQGIEKITGKRIADQVMAAAWPNLTFTVDPIASSLQTSADHAVRVGLLDRVDLSGIYDLRILNELLAKEGRATVASR